MYECFHDDAETLPWGTEKFCSLAFSWMLSICHSYYHSDCLSLVQILHKKLAGPWYLSVHHNSRHLMDDFQAVKFWLTFQEANKSADKAANLCGRLGKNFTWPGNNPDVVKQQLYFDVSGAYPHFMFHQASVFKRHMFCLIPPSILTSSSLISSFLLIPEYKLIAPTRLCIIDSFWYNV